MPCRSSALAVNALIDAGTRSRFSERFSAVTTISVSAVSSSAASAALAGVPCRVASTARVSADAPLSEPALMSAALPPCERIPPLILLFLDNMFFPLLALFRRFSKKIGRYVLGGYYRPGLALRDHPDIDLLSSAHANWRQPPHPQLFWLLPPKADIEAATPRTLDAFPPFAYLEPEAVAQATRFARHLLDLRRHLLDLSAWKLR